MSWKKILDEDGCHRALTASHYSQFLTHAVNSLTTERVMGRREILGLYLVFGEDTYMINATQIRSGIFLKINNDLFSVLKVQHVTPGKGNAVVQTELRNLRTGIKINQRFRSTETVEAVELVARKMNFLYQDGTTYHFMDPETYEQVELPEGLLGETIKFLKPEAQITIYRHDGKAVSVSLAARITFEVKQCDPPTKGFAGATKDAILENGNVVKVPLFIKVGDFIVVDTETNTYLEKG